jgi:non-specific serine/threonine protein kinase
VVVGDQIIVSGGQADGKLNPTTEVFDGTAWKRVTDLPTPREHLGMATDGTYAYVVGGRDLSSDKNSSALERYDPKTDSWAALAAMPAPRGGAGAAVADGRLVVAGGEEPTAVDNSVYAYDITSNTWSDLPPLPTGRHGPRSPRSTRRSTRSAAPRRPATRRPPGWARRCRSRPAGCSPRRCGGR